jgi:hypothetical protein
MAANVNIPFFVDVTVLNGTREEPGKINLNMVIYVKRTIVDRIWDEEKGRYEQDEATAVFFVDGTSIHIRDDMKVVDA